MPTPTAHAATPLAGALNWWAFPHAPGQRSEPMLRRVLGQRLGRAPEAVPLERGSYGQPVLRPEDGCPGPRVSASHAGEWLLVALADDVQPGIDIERIRPRPNAVAIAQRYFTPAEAATIAALDDDRAQAMFLRSWVLREAVLKAIGRGLAFGLDRLVIDPDPSSPRLLALDGDDPARWQLQWLPAPPGYLAAVAWRGRPRSLAFRGPAAWEAHS